MLQNNFKTAWRNLQRNKGFSLLNIAGLAVGLAATLVIALWIQDEIKHDKFHTNGARLYQVLLLYLNHELSYDRWHPELRKVYKVSVIAVPISWWAAHEWLQGFAYRITLNGWLFALAACAVLAVAALTVGIHTLKAARANIADNLRDE